MKTFMAMKNSQGGEYYGHSILLLESICEVEDFSSGTLLKYIMIIIAYLKN